MGAETAFWYNNYCLIGFAEERGKAWHYRQSAQGQEPNHYQGAIPVDDVIRRLFSWEAVPTEVQFNYTDPESGEQISVIDSTRQGIMRSDTLDVFGVFKQGYQIHQHGEWLVETSKAILSANSGDLGIANAVLLKKGAVACVQYEVPETIKTKEGVNFRPSLLAAGSMDGSLSTTFKRVVTNVVCDNTMSAALGERNAAQLKVKHSKFSNFKLADARNALEIVFDIAEEFAQEVEALCAIEVKGSDFRKLLDIWVPLPEDTTKASKALTMAEKKRDELLTMWMHDERVTPWIGTAYGVLQLNNTYNHHKTATNKGTVRGERNFFQAANGELEKSDRLIMDTLLNKVLVSV